MKKKLIIFLMFISFFAFSHSVQVQYCVSCNGDLRIWLEHWHGAEDPNTTNMTISVTINGNTNTYTSTPGGAVMNIPSSLLPGCSTPITYGAGCLGEENTYDDWVYYDFPGLPANVPLAFTIISGNTVFTMDGCGMYPLTINFTISTILSIDDQYICDGDSTLTVIMDNNATWTNSNPLIGLPSSGVGSIPSFLPNANVGDSATITFSSTCAVGSFDYIFSPSLNISSLSSNYNGYNISCNGYNDGYINIDINSGSSPYSYSWDNGEVTEDLDSLVAGSYSLVITDIIGCSLTETIILNEPTPFQNTIEASTDYNGYHVSCYGYNDGAINVNVSGSVPGYTYLWSNGDLTSTISGLSAGIYSVSITDSNLCSTTSFISLIEPIELQSSIILSDIGGYNTCYQEQDANIDLTVIGSVPGYNYHWSNGDTIEDLQDLGAGIYSYIVTDQNGCITMDSVEIIQPLLNIQENVTDVSCYQGSNGHLSVNVSGSTSPYYVFWGNNINTSFLSAGTYTYQIIDSIGCIYNDSLIVFAPDPFVVLENINNVSCNGLEDGSIQLDISGATPPYYVDWYGFDTINMLAGSYSYTISDSNNCTFSGIAIVNQPNPIDVLNVVSDPSCNNTFDGSVSLQISGGTASYFVDWGGNNPDSLSIGTYHFIVTDINNCIDSNAVILASESNISINNTINAVSCRGFCDGSIDLVINGGINPYTINWFGFDPAFLCEGDVYFEVSDGIGCLFSDTFQVAAPDSITLQINQSSSQLEAIATGGLPPYQFEWFNNTGFSSNNQIIPIINNGFYYCVVIDQNNCQSDTASFNYSDVWINDEDNVIFAIYPNPAEYSFVIETDLDNKSKLEIYMINSLGQNILLDKNSAIFGKYSKHVDVTKKSSGIYIIKLIIDDTSYYHKIVIE